MDTKEIKAFVFDLDYTLYDEMQFFESGMKDVGEAKHTIISAKNITLMRNQ